MRDSLDDEAIDTNAEVILRHVLNEHEGAAEAVNMLHQEVAKRISA